MWSWTKGISSIWRKTTRGINWMSNTSPAHTYPHTHNFKYLILKFHYVFVDFVSGIETGRREKCRGKQKIGKFNKKKEKSFNFSLHPLNEKTEMENSKKKHTKLYSFKNIALLFLCFGKFSFFHFLHFLTNFIIKLCHFPFFVFNTNIREKIVFPSSVGALLAIHVRMLILSYARNKCMTAKTRKFKFSNNFPIIIYSHLIVCSCEIHSISYAVVSHNTIRHLIPGNEGKLR